jgi:hypothetical protein
MAQLQEAAKGIVSPGNRTFDLAGMHNPKDLGL